MWMAWLSCRFPPRERRTHGPPQNHRNRAGRAADTVVSRTRTYRGEGCHMPVDDYDALMWEPLTMPGTGKSASPPRCGPCARSRNETSRCSRTPTPHCTGRTWTQPVSLSTTSPHCYASSNKVRQTDHSRARGDRRPILVLVSDTVLFSYVHLRARHPHYGWTSESARDAVVNPAANGYLPRAGAGGARRQARPQRRRRRPPNTTNRPRPARTTIHGVVSTVDSRRRSRQSSHARSF
jgi:hypothetical protein